MVLEIEHRFLVLRMDRSVFGHLPRERILQGYLQPWNPRTQREVRVRIINETQAVLTTKIGQGTIRQEEETPISIEEARRILANTRYIIEKIHYHSNDGWVIEVFSYPLKGIVIAEIELSSAGQEVRLPPWIYEAFEVTDSISGSKLAKAACELRGRTLGVRALMHRLGITLPAKPLSA